MTQNTIQTPAARLIKRFGAKRLAAWADKHPSRVYSWGWAPERGGTGGVVPHRSRPKIIEGARRDLNEALAPIDFEPAPGEGYLFGVAA